VDRSPKTKILTVEGKDVILNFFVHLQINYVSIMTNTLVDGRSWLTCQVIQK